MRILKIIIIMRAIDVGGNDGSEVAAVLFVVEMVEDIDHSFGVGVSKVGVVGGAVVEHVFVDGVGGFVGENTSRQTAHTFLHLKFEGTLQDIFINQLILGIKLKLVLHILKQPTNHRRQMNHMSGFMFGKTSSSGLQVGQIGIFRRQKDKFSLGFVLFGDIFDGLSY